MRGRLMGLAILVLTAIPQWAIAASSELDNVDLSAVLQQIESGNYSSAMTSLTTYTQANPWDADGFNWLGYSYRKLGRFDLSEQAYARALRLDPQHKGAHEYLGELYLQTGRLVEAKEKLAALEAICGKDCEEYRELAQAIVAHQNN